MRTKRITRQLKKVFGDESLEDGLVAMVPPSEAQVTADLVAALKDVLGKFPEFLNVVEETYQQLEEKATIAQRSMEVSAEELTHANSRLFRLNQTFDAMVNSLGQGFVLFGNDGVCLDVFSKACEDLLEVNPAGKTIADVLRVPAEKRAGFQDWMGILFQDMLDFTEFSRLGPRTFPHSKGKRINVEFMPVRNTAGQIDLIIAIATDVTVEFEANERADAMKAHAILVTSILKNRDRFDQFVHQFRRNVTECEKILAGPIERLDDLIEVKRHLHALKGAGGSFGMRALQLKIHETESAVAAFEAARDARDYLLGQLSALREIFERTLDENAEYIGIVPKSDELTRQISVAKLLEFERLLADPGCDPRDLRRHFVDELIGVSCRSIFARFDSEAQETASRVGKKVGKIVVEGDDVTIVPEQFSELFLNLAHVFRNVVDHGIETPEARQAAGKPQEGNIRVGISRVPGGVEFHISDDGQGIDVEKVKTKLRERGQHQLAENGSKDEILDAIFLPGLSTAQTVTEVSGRGIGLEAVRACLSRLGGEISVSSEQGKGTRFTICLPLHQSFRLERKQVPGVERERN